jgi:iron complex outermembrane receptor protein
MFQERLMMKSLVRVIGCGFSASLMLALPAFAQATAPATAPATTTGPTTVAPVQLQRFEVTGSSIKRIDGETALPVLVLSLDDIQRTGVSNTEQLLKTVTAMQTAGSTTAAGTGSGGGQGGGSSAATISLRGLGANRTLVLINGRRGAAAGGGSAVDIASIPIAAIDRIEVLKDGASAVYGSDAVAGVVNFIMRKNFSGTDVSTTWGAPTRHGGGTEKKISVYTGFGDINADRYSVTLAASYAYAQPIFGDTRSFARNLDRANQLDKTSTTAFPANVRLNNGTLGSPVFPNCDPSIAGGLLNPALCVYDNAPYDALQPRTKLSIASATARFKLSNTAELYAEPSFTRNDTLNTIQHVLINGAALPSNSPYIATMTNLITAQPAAVQTALRGLIGSGWAFLPSTSPYYPTAWVNSQPNLIPGQPLPLLFRSFPTGTRITSDVNDTSRVVAGIRGAIAGWDYDAGVLYSQWKNKNSLVQGWALFDKYLTQVDSGVINPFGPTTDASALQAAMASNYVGPFSSTTNAVKGADAKASREVFKLPAGAVSVAFGGEVRKETYNFTPSSANANFLVSGFGAAGVGASGSRKVESAYAETNVPLLKDVTAFKSLEVDAAVRFDRYERVGDTTNPKGSIRWQPLTGLLLRASAGSGFRAPTLNNLYSPATRGITTNGSRDLIRCPPGTTGIIDCSTQFVTLGGGNQNLQPEKSLSETAGLAWEPTKNYTIGVDFYRITVSDLISSAFSAATILNDPVKYAGFIHRGPTDGNASGQGPIVGIDQLLINLGKTNVDGFDVDFTGRVFSTDQDKITIRANGTYVMRYDQQQSSGLFTNSINNPASGGIGLVLRWKHTAGVTWKHGMWLGGLSQNYQVGYHDTRTSLQTVANTPVPRKVAPYETYDAQLSYNGIKNVKLTVGVKNLLDRDPPYTNYGGGFVGGYDLSYTDVRGRFAYVTATYSFK